MSGCLKNEIFEKVKFFFFERFGGEVGCVFACLVIACLVNVCLVLF